MNKAELRAGVDRARADFESDRIMAKEYALLLDELLSKYLGIRRVSCDEVPGQDDDRVTFPEKLAHMRERERDGGFFIELATLAAATDTPVPCRSCGRLVAHDVQGQVFATDPAVQMPWQCPSSRSGRHSFPGPDGGCGHEPEGRELALDPAMDFQSGDWITYRNMYPDGPDFRALVKRFDARNRGVVVVDEPPGFPLEHMVAWDRIVGKTEAP